MNAAAVMVSRNALSRVIGCSPDRCEQGSGCDPPAMPHKRQWRREGM